MNVEVNLSGWGAEAKAKMTQSSMENMSISSVRFLATRDIKLGFEGWRIPAKLN